MKFTLEEFEIYGSDGFTHLKFTATVEGQQIKFNYPLYKNNKNDVDLLNAIGDYCRTKVGEIND